MIEVEVELFGRSPNRILQPEVEHVVRKIRPHQKLRRQIVDAADVSLYVVFLGGEPAGENPVAHRISESHEVVPVGRGIRPFAHNVEQIVQKPLL